MRSLEFGIYYSCPSLFLTIVITSESSLLVLTPPRTEYLADNQQYERFAKQKVDTLSVDDVCGISAKVNIFVALMLIDFQNRTIPQAQTSLVENVLFLSCLCFNL